MGRSSSKARPKRRFRVGSMVEPTDLSAFKGAESFTPYLVCDVHRDGTVDLSVAGRPERGVVARGVDPSRLTSID
jgi:hypothetical protein